MKVSKSLGFHTLLFTFKVYQKCIIHFYSLSKCIKKCIKSESQCKEMYQVIINNVKVQFLYYLLGHQPVNNEC